MPQTETASLQKQRLRLNNSDAWLELWELRLTTTAYFVTGNPSSVSFGGVTYSPFPIGRAEVEQTQDGRITSTSLSVCNVDRVVESNAETLVGKTAILRIVNSAELSSTSNVYAIRFIVETIEAGDVFARLQLSQVNLLSRQFPKNHFSRTRCGWVYGSKECGYDTTRSGAIATCDHTLSGANGCTVHGDDEVAAGKPRLHPLRFGGEPSILKGPFA